MKLKHWSMAILWLLPLLAAAEPAPAGQEAVQEHRQGLYASLLGDPGINLIGVNFAYWSQSTLRFSFGAGTSFFVSSFGASLQYYFVEPHAFRPFLGLGVNLLSVSDFHESSFFGRVNTVTLYENLKAGVEYASEGGFFVSLHVQALWFHGGDADHTIYFDPVPALSIGSYF